MEIVEETIKHAEKIGAKYCGFSVVDNYYFRAKKWREVGFVCSKVALIKKSGINYDQKLLAMDDYAFTAENLKKFGKVLINNFVFPHGIHYQKGGIGNYKEREVNKIADSKYLIKKYPGLFRYKTKVNRHPKAEIQMVFTNLIQVERWKKKQLGRTNLGDWFK